MTKRTTSIRHRRSLPTCACCIAAMIAGASAAAATTTTTRALSDQPAFLSQYIPETNVDAYAALDLDQRSITARLATGDEEGLLEAEVIYMQGRSRAEDDGLTLQGLSTEADEKFGGVSITYERFVQYYGEGDYADTILQAAFGGDATLSLDLGNYDFNNFGVEGRAAAIRWGTPLLNIWMYVVGLLEVAADNCDRAGDQPAMIYDWDTAVALYVGSEAREAGKGGHSIYTLANVECYKFGTCEKNGEAPINTMIFGNFTEGKRKLESGNCRHARNSAEHIKSLMTVLLVQGVTRVMYAIDVQDDFQETTQGMGAAFASAILPLVNHCSSGRAQILFRDLAPGKALKGSYEVVKDALTRSYECLGIDCNDVGGLVNFRGDGYLKGAEACGYVPPTEYNDYEQDEDGDSLLDLPSAGLPPVSDGSSKAGVSPAQSDSEPSYQEDNVNVALAVGLSAGTLVLGVLFGLVMAHVCGKKKEEERKFVAATLQSTNEADIL